jgi:Protein of unknown function (DUF2167)
MGGIAKRVLFAWIMLIAGCGAAALSAGSDNPIGFSEPLKLTRGKVVARSPNATYLSHAETCRFLVTEQGWPDGDCDGVENLLAVPVPGIDSAIVYKPVSEGFVRFDDWSGSKDEIDGIWRSFVDAMKEQSRQLGKSLVPEGWLVYPKLDKNRAYMYYALILNWDGHREINIKASLFDRSGYIPFLIVPEGSDIDAAGVQTLVTRFLASYTSDPESSYFDFKNGDKVAVAGTVGVLAALMGVKVAKVAAIGLLAAALAIGKKLVFLLVVVPFLALRRLFRRRAE